MPARTRLALLAVLRDDAAAAAEQYAPLQSRMGTMYRSISTDRLLGLLAQTMGNLDKAAEHFEDALAFCRRAGYRPELAWTCCDYAEALLDPVGAALGGRPGHPHRGAPTPGDRAKAMALLGEALGITRQLGMRPLMEKVIALRGKVKLVGAIRRIASTHADGLTEREVEVLRLIALGKSNREIAGELVLSVRTVERHITNFYAKINARGRADATSYALSHGLARHP